MFRSYRVNCREFTKGARDLAKVPGERSFCISPVALALGKQLSYFILAEHIASPRAERSEATEPRPDSASSDRR